MSQMTLDEIYQAARQLPPDQLDVLVKRLKDRLQRATRESSISQAPPPGSLAAHAAAAKRANIQVSVDDVAARSREILEERAEHLARWMDEESEPSG